MESKEGEEKGRRRVREWDGEGKGREGNERKWMRRDRKESEGMEMEENG